MFLAVYIRNSEYNDMIFLTKGKGTIIGFRSSRDVLGVDACSSILTIHL